MRIRTGKVRLPEISPCPSPDPAPSPQAWAARAVGDGGVKTVNAPLRHQAPGSFLNGKYGVVMRKEKMVLLPSSLKKLKALHLARLLFPFY